MLKLLIIGAGFLQSFVIRKAKELGYYTITIDKNPNSIGFRFADEHAVIDIIDQTECLRFAKEKNIDGVMTAATDYGVLPAAFVARELKLPGLDYEIARKIKNKYMVRQSLIANKVDDISQCFEVGNNENIEDIINTIRFPVMVKPCDGSGSKAVKRVNSKDEIKNACLRALETSLIGKVLIEDYIEGIEYGAESFVFDGKIYVLGIMGKRMTDPPDYAELGHFLPSELLIEARVKNIVENTISILGINFGAVNMDILVTKDNRICVIDIGARMGGNMIGSHIIPLGTGIDYMGNLIRAALNEPVNMAPQLQEKPVASSILALKPGKIYSLPNFSQIKEQYNVEIYHNLETGQIIREYHDNLDGCGYVIATGTDQSDCRERASAAKKLIDDSIIRE